MSEPTERQEPITGEEMRQASSSEHPDREEAKKEKADRAERDREEMGRPPGQARERAHMEGVTARRDREAREEADRIERQSRESRGEDES